MPGPHIHRGQPLLLYRDAHIQRPLERVYPPGILNTRHHSPGIPDSRLMIALGDLLQPPGYLRDRLALQDGLRQDRCYPPAVPCILLALFYILCNSLAVCVIQLRLALVHVLNTLTAVQRIRCIQQGLLFYLECRIVVVQGIDFRGEPLRDALRYLGSVHVIRCKGITQIFPPLADQHLTLTPADVFLLRLGAVSDPFLPLGILVGEPCQIIIQLFGNFLMSLLILLRYQLLDLRYFLIGRYVRRIALR